MAAGVVAGLLVPIGWYGLHSTRADDAASAAGTASATSRSATPASTLGHLGSPGRPSLRTESPATAPGQAVESTEPPTSVVVPLPTRLGGGTPVSPSTTELADQLRLVPEHLAELAEEPGGEVPPTIIRRLEDAQAQGTALGERLGLDPSDTDLLASRFTNQLVRVERQMQISPQPVKLADVQEMVTRDTLEDLRRNLGDDVAKAAEQDVRGLQPLRPR
jgi:hypothetical protein